MLSRIQKSIIRDILVVLPLSAICLNFVLMMERLLKLSRLLSGVGASFSDFIYFMILVQPQLLVLTLPMSFLLSLLIVYGRMNMDSESVAMRSLGMSMRQISKPAAYTGFVIFVMTAAMTFYLSPVSARKMRAFVNRTIKTQAPLSFEEGIFHNELKGVTLMIGHKPSPEKMENLFAYDVTDIDRPKVITSAQGKILFDDAGEVFFDVRNGHINTIKDNSFTEMSFDRYVFKIEMGMELLSEKTAEKTTYQLLRETDRVQGKRRSKLFTEFHRRFTLPLMNIFLIFLAPALSMASGKSGKLAGFIYGVAVFCAYYFLLIYVESLIHSGRISHYFAWSPILIIGMLSVYLYRKESRK